MKKRITALALTLLLLLPTVLSCGGSAGDETTSAPLADGTATDTEPSPSDTAPADPKQDALPDDLDYTGKTIHIISRGRDWCKDEVSVEEETGDVIGDAIFKRNLAVEERLGLTIENHLTSNPDQFAITETIRTQVQSGTKEFDLLVNSTYGTMNYTADGLFQNLQPLTYLDLEQPYWSQGFNETASVGNAQYLATGAACLSMYRFIFATFFNKNLFDQQNTPYLYDTVNQGKWTLDCQRELSETFYSDLNGNGKADAPDRFGFASNHNMIGVDPYWSACGLSILNKDDKNFLTYTLNVDRLSTAVEKINQLFWENDGAYRAANKTNDTEQDELCAMFAQDRAAMVTLRLIHVESAEMRNMTSLYGIVPIPKLDETQTEYASYAHDQISSLAIPLTVLGDDLEMVGAFMEAMASESARIVTPAYYELALKTKYVSDEESVVMLDRIVQSLHIDAGILYSRSIGLIHGKLRDWIGANNSNVSSVIKSTQRVTEKMLDKLNASFTGLQ